MIIVVTSDTRVELRDPSNFRALKIVDELGGGVERLASALEGIAKVAPDGAFAWVAQDRVAGLLGSGVTEEWRAGFQAMIGAARKFGWIDEADGAGRAHIERAATSPDAARPQ